MSFREGEGAKLEEEVSDKRKRRKEKKGKDVMNGREGIEEEENWESLKHPDCDLHSNIKFSDQNRSPPLGF